MDHTDEDVHSLQLQFFDTLPPGASINILKSCYLFLAAESSNHGSFSFKSDGSDEQKAIVCCSQDSAKHEESQDSIPRFNPRKPINLEAKDEMQNLAPINDMKVEDLTSEG